MGYLILIIEEILGNCEIVKYCEILHDLSNNRVEINAGDRTAQVLFFLKKKSPRFIEVSSFDNFTTERGNKGFGLTGI